MSNGKIKGTVTYSNGDPSKDIIIGIIDRNTEKNVRYIKTDASGAYTCSGMAYGDYRVSALVTGETPGTSTAEDVELTAANPEATKVDFVVT